LNTSTAAPDYIEFYDGKHEALLASIEHNREAPDEILDGSDVCEEPRQARYAA